MYFGMGWMQPTRIQVVSSLTFRLPALSGSCCVGAARGGAILVFVEDDEKLQLRCIETHD